MLLPEFGDDDLCFDLQAEFCCVPYTTTRCTKSICRLISDDFQRSVSCIIGFKNFGLRL
jgi:hypothetical protein